MADRLFEVQYGPGGEVVFRFRPQRLRTLAPEAQEHLRRSAVEFLLAFRSLVDGAIQRLEKGEPAPRRRIRVEEAKGKAEAG